jgi:hypothetical protein
MFIYLNFQLLVLILKLFWFFKFHHFLVNFLSLLFVVYFFHLLFSDFIFHSHLHLIDSQFFNLRIKRWIKRKSKLTIFRNFAKKIIFFIILEANSEIVCTLESFNLFRFSSRIIFSRFQSKST